MQQKPQKSNNIKIDGDGNTTNITTSKTVKWTITASLSLGLSSLCGSGYLLHSNAVNQTQLANMILKLDTQKLDDLIEKRNCEERNRTQLERRISGFEEKNIEDLKQELKMIKEKINNFTKRIEELLGAGIKPTLSDLERWFF